MSDHDTTSPNPSEPPEDAYVQSEISLLSPASPKPIHVPQPTNIPVLDKMMDVGFNQTEIHMSDPAMHNTELRPDAWRDPNEEANGNDSPFSTGGEAVQSSNNDNTESAANSNQTDSGGAHDDATASGAAFSNGNSYEANSHLNTSDPSSMPSTSDPTPTVDAAESAPTADATPSHASAVDISNQTQPTPLPTHDAPADGTADGSTAATVAQSPSQSQIQPPVNATPTNDSSIQPAPSLGAPSAGLPPRPPPQEQPLMNQNYVHAQNLRDFHPHASLPAAQSHAHANSSGNAANAFVSPTQSHSHLGNFSQTQQQPAPPGTASSVATPYPQATQHRSPSTAESRREAFNEDDQPWTADIQRKYDHFLDEERRYVNEARWDQFPPGSRLFVGMQSQSRQCENDQTDAGTPQATSPRRKSQNETSSTSSTPTANSLKSPSSKPTDSCSSCDRRTVRVH
jgi:hypothetical protein